MLYLIGWKSLVRVTRGAMQELQPICVPNRKGLDPRKLFVKEFQLQEQLKWFFLVLNIYCPEENGHENNN